MGTETSGAKVTKRPKARQFSAEWRTGPDRYVVLSVGHSAGGRCLYASLRRERSEVSCGMESRIFAPFQDVARFDRLRVPRYSAKTAEAYFEEQLARVEAVRAGASDEKSAEIMVIFTEPTEA